jgi:hypothetical protein
MSAVSHLFSWRGLSETVSGSRKSYRNLPAVFGRGGDGSTIEGNNPVPQHNPTGVLNLQQQRCEL